MNALENRVLETIRQMNLMCFGDLGHVRIRDVFPSQRTVATGDQFEFDHFVVYGNKCLVGEISGISDSRGLEKKYSRFKRNFDILSSSADSDTFDHFNIPTEYRHLFNEVTDFQAFFIAYKHEQFDTELKKAQGISVVYRSDWDTLEQYAKAMGKFAQYPFLGLLNITEAPDRNKDLRFSTKSHSLMRVPNRSIAQDLDVLATIYTFRASPADLLDIAEVFRRELMPIVASGSKDRYQRPLDFSKLADMKRLVSSRNFMFPNSVLIALDSDHSFENHTETLRIPMTYGSVSVIDGQHRLFSYASRDLSDDVRKDARILVTAVDFQTKDDAELRRCSAKTFVEINQKQKRISSNHIDEIAYPVLGEEYPKAIAAQIILRCNQRTRGPLHSIFRSRQTTRGVYSAATVSVHLASIMNLTKIKNLAAIKRPGTKKADHKAGYENLFNRPVNGIIEAQQLIEGGQACLEQYCKILRRVLSEDWSTSKHIEDTSLKYTKVFAAFVKLLDQFLKEGLDWSQVEDQLKTIKRHIVSQRDPSLGKSNVVLLLSDPIVPDDGPSVTNTFKFLEQNRRTPTSIRDV